ncbi:hypothetical protein Pmani_006112 [Petrolisthes manimaculis]|uniref:Major facilitator superfamily (MFS) profile domain-containing protein n=1 Tax=Petrolisthes manimaculis TaxID=1843537 RepID=A0AAE1UG08_9EUCA|nr:hypothetical protein Pmani_006112 [Petrolisthes manimaculis]
MDYTDSNTKSHGSKESPGANYFIYQGLVTMAGCVVAFLTSAAMGYTSPALSSMRADPHFSITREQESWVGAVMPAGALVGSLAAGPLMNHLGRRLTQLYIVCPFILAWALIATGKGIGVVVAGRVLCGACVGVAMSVRIVYMAEIIQFDLRRIFNPIITCVTQLGMLVSFVAGQWLSWRGLAWLGVVYVIPLLPLLLILPETPYHLTRTGRRDESLAVLSMIRRTTEEAELEQEQIDKSCHVRNEGNNTWQKSIGTLAAPSNMWPVGVGLALMVAQQTTGITAVYFFASTILSPGNDGGGNQKTGYINVVMGVVNFLGTILSIYGIRYYRRRSLLQMSSSMIVASLLVLALFFWVQESGEIYPSDVGNSWSYVPTIALLTYILGFNMGWGGIPFVFIIEGMPSWIRGQATSVLIATHWGMAFLVSKTFMWSLATLGSSTTFLAFAIVTAINNHLILRAMPETYRKTTAHMNQVYLDAVAKKEQ